MIGLASKPVQRFASHKGLLFAVAGAGEQSALATCVA
jgi:hypothetical protein